MDISFIIPLYNEEDLIRECIRSVLNIVEGRNLTYEILVVDNGSDDSGPSIASFFPEVTVLSITRTSVAKARNYGVKLSKGRILTFIDSDVVLNPPWGETIEKLIGDEKQFFVTGCQYGIRKDPSWIERYWFGSMRSAHINGGNLIVSRSAFLKIGGFDSRLKTGEDVDFCDKARNSADVDYYVNPGFDCVHLGYPRNLMNFFKRELWHGEGDFRNFSHFKKSKIAILSVLYGSFFLLSAGALVLQEWKLALGILICFVIMNLLITYRRFSDQSIRYLLCNSIINCIYFSARFLSLFRAIAHRKLEY